MPADEVLLRNVDVLELYGGGRAGTETHFGHFFSNPHTLPPGLDDKRPHESWPLRVELSKNCHAARIIGVCNVSLLTVQQIMGIILARQGGRFDMLSVRSKAGLGQSVGKNHLSGCRRGQVFTSLLFGPEKLDCFYPY